MPSRNAAAGPSTRNAFGAALLVLALSFTQAWAQDPGDSQMDFANGLLQRGFHKDAAREYGVYLEKFPKGAHVPTALYRLGEAEYALKDYEAALKAFDRFLAQQGAPDLLPRVQLRRGEVLYRLKKLPEAIAALKPLTAPDAAPAVRPSALYYLGKAAYDAGSHADARAALQELTEKHAGDALAPYGRFQLAYVLLALEETEKAAAEFAAVGGSDADPALRAESRFLAAETYDKLGWYEPAVKAYQQLRQDFPDSEFARKAAYGYAWSLYHAGQFAEAAKAAEEFLAGKPEGDAAVGMLYLQANCLQQQKDYDRAIELYRGIAAKHGDSAFAERARYKVLWALYLAGRTADAKAELTGFLETNQNEQLAGDAAFLLGSLLMAEQNYAEACTQFTLVSQKFPSSEFAAEALFKAAECRVRLDQTADAAKIFDDFATRYPQNPLAAEAVLRAGDAHFAAAAYEQAVGRYAKVLEAPPSPEVEQETRYRLAVSRHNLQDHKGSAEAFQALVDKFPANPHAAEAHLRIGDYYLYEVKDPVKAMQSYEAARKADAAGDAGGRATRGLALARYESKDYDGAAALFLELMAQHPEIDLGREIYAWVGQRMTDAQKWDEAGRAFDALLKAHPDHPEADVVRFQLGQARQAAGKPDEALAVFQELAARGTDNPVGVQARYHLAQAYDCLLYTSRCV